ncbi:MAG: cytochrome c3 family protein [Deltaproteobacteria bacterium]|nr:cytochrome c3 family protein [Deltaproteobacteria bacterium]
MTHHDPHTKQTSRLPLLMAALAIAACATLTYKVPQLREQLIFSHKKHVGEADCSDCHGDIAQATGPTEGKFIGKGGKHGGCTACHDDEVADKDQCKMCHVGKDKNIKLSRRTRNLNFSHKAHDKSRVKDGCKTCHAAAYTTTKPGTKMVPKMSVCTDSCHKKQMAELQCSGCHKNLESLTVPAVSLAVHDGNFHRRHGTLARNTQTCAQCHDQTFCADCHARTQAMPASIRFPEQINRRFVHRGDFVGRHMVEARARPETCAKCHGARHCQSCHEFRGVTPPKSNTTVASAAGRRVHGADVMKPGTPGFHGNQARRAINRCASCHDQGAQSNCVRCHKVGELGGNPHPTGFSWRGQSTACRENVMCGACHIAGAGCK